MALDYRIRYYFDVTPHDQLVAHKGACMLSDPPIHAEVAPHTIVDLPAGIRSNFQAYNKIGFRPRRDRIEFFDRETVRWLGTYRRAGTIKDGLMGPGLSLPVSSKAAASTSSVTVSTPNSLTGSSRAAARTIHSMGARLAELGFGARDDDIQLEGVYQDFFRGLDDLTRRNYPVSTRFTEAREDETNRYCIVLALLEEVFRMGGGPNSPLFRKEHTSAGNLLDIPEDHWIDDMRILSWKFYDSFNHLPTLPYSLNPTFEGSRDVGGADADLIVDSALIDIKTTIESKVRNEWLWQLLGYVLLDYSDHNRINGVGLYMARQGILFQWDVEEAIRGLCPGAPPSLEELRKEFKQVAKAWQARRHRRLQAVSRTRVAAP